MPALIEDANSNTASSTVEAVGSIIVSVTGVFSSGLITLVGDIGYGEVALWYCTPADTRRVIGLDLKPGVSFKVYVKGLADTDSVTVGYINV